MVKITVVPSPYKRGYSLKHDQYKGWSGTIREDNIWAWYKYKYDAVENAKKLNEFYNK